MILVIASDYYDYTRYVRRQTKPGTPANAFKKVNSSQDFLGIPRATKVHITSGAFLNAVYSALVSEAKARECILTYEP